MTEAPTQRKIVAGLRAEALSEASGVQARAELTSKWHAADLIEALAAQLAEAQKQLGEAVREREDYNGKHQAACIALATARDKLIELLEVV